jgi:hypothetical protein
MALWWCFTLRLFFRKDAHANTSIFYGYFNKGGQSIITVVSKNLSCDGRWE